MIIWNDGFFDDYFRSVDFFDDFLFPNDLFSNVFLLNLIPRIPLYKHGFVEVSSNNHYSEHNYGSTDYIPSHRQSRYGNRLDAEVLNILRMMAQ